MEYRRWVRTAASHQILLQVASTINAKPSPSSKQYSSAGNRARIYRHQRKLYTFLRNMDLVRSYIAAYSSSVRAVTFDSHLRRIRAAPRALQTHPAGRRCTAVAPPIAPTWVWYGTPMSFVHVSCSLWPLTELAPLL